MIDTHSHIYSEEFDEDRDKVIARAEEAGVELIFLPAIDSESHERQETLSASCTHLFRQMMGLHPTSVNENYETELEIVKKKLFDSHTTKTSKPSHNKYIAVGEIGLDFYWDTTYREEQIAVLRRQIAWAVELELPVVLHLRSGKEGTPETDAYKTLFDRFLVSGSRFQVSGIMHCFSGSMEDARRAVEMGFLLGIGGVVTYKKSNLPEIVREVGLQNIVLETDAPYLAPVPYRGRRNESSYVRYVAEKVAEILGVSMEEVDAATTENAKRLIRMPRE